MREREGREEERGREGGREEGRGGRDTVEFAACCKAQTNKQCDADTKRHTRREDLKQSLPDKPAQHQRAMSALLRLLLRLVVLLVIRLLQRARSPLPLHSTCPTHHSPNTPSHTVDPELKRQDPPLLQSRAILCLPRPGRPQMCELHARNTSCMRI